MLFPWRPGGGLLGREGCSTRTFMKTLLLMIEIVIIIIILVILVIITTIIIAQGAPARARSSKRSSLAS